MEFPRKRVAVKILILLSIFGILFVTFLFLFYGKKASHLSKELTPSSKLAYGKGISYVEYHGDKKVCSVSINSFSVERARLGPFAIGPLHIARLNKVTVDLYLDGIESKPGEENIDFQSPILNIKKNLPLQIKKIKGIEIKDISFNLWKNEKRIFGISSDTATVDHKTGDLIFTGHAIMDAGQNGKLQSYRIRWDRKTRLFKVIDPFYLIKDGKRMEGKGIETDCLLKRINYQVSNNK